MRKSVVLLLFFLLSLIFICYTIYINAFTMTNLVSMYYRSNQVSEQTTLWRLIRHNVIAISGSVVVMVYIVLLLVISIKNITPQATKENVQARIEIIKKNSEAKKKEKKFRKLQQLKEKINKLESDE